MKRLIMVMAVAVLLAGLGNAWAAKGSAKGEIQGVVNINTATASELALLPGVGKAKADAIIANRPFKSPQDIVKVKGIGPKMYEKMKVHVVVDGPTTAKKVAKVAAN